MIKPDDNWRWYFDVEHDRLMLDLSNQMLFRSRFPGKALAIEAFTDVVFSVEDTTSFFSFEEVIRHLPLKDELRAELVLNCIVAQRFLKPTLPKSWYFNQSEELIEPVVGQIVAVSLQHSDEEAFFVVVEVSDVASLCILAQPQLMLATKPMLIGEAIKIMHNRLLSVEIQRPYQFHLDEAI